MFGVFRTQAHSLPAAHTMNARLVFNSLLCGTLLACSSTDVVAPKGDGETVGDAGTIPAMDASSTDAQSPPGTDAQSPPGGPGFSNRSRDALTSRWGAQVAPMTDGKYMIFGGFRGETPLNDLFIVDAKSTEWITTPIAAKNPPAARSRGNMVYNALTSVAYVYGGRASGSALSDDDLHVLDMATSTWSKLTVDPRPRALVGSSMVWSQDCACGYLFGGGSSTLLLAETWRFDTAPTPRFTKLETPSAPSPRNDSTWVVVPGERRALLFAGSKGVQSGTFMNDLWSFDFQTEKWSPVETKGTAPPARRGAFATLDRTRKRMIIGLGESKSGSLDDLASFEIATSTWSALPYVWDRKKDSDRVFPLSLQGATHDGWLAGGLDQNFGGTSDGAFSLEIPAP